MKLLKSAAAFFIRQLSLVKTRSFRAETSTQRELILRPLGKKKKEKQELILRFGQVKCHGLGFRVCFFFFPFPFLFFFFQFLVFSFINGLFFKAFWTKDQGNFVTFHGLKQYGRHSFLYLKQWKSRARGRERKRGWSLYSRLGSTIQGDSLTTPHSLLSLS